MALVRTGYDPWSQALPSPWTAWADRIDGTVLGFLPIVGSLNYNVSLSGIGTGEATIAIEESPIEPVEMKRLYSWRLWVMYGGTPVWCGLPTWVKDETGPAVTVGLVEITGYLKKRVFDDPPAHEPGGSKDFSNVEQTEIARQLAAPVADVGVGITTTPGLSPVYRDRTYEYLEGPYRADLLQRFCEIIQGPEYRVEYGMGAATPWANLHIAYPRLGLAMPDSPLALTLPGNAMGPGITWDGDKLRTRTFAQGDVPETRSQEVDQEPEPRPVVMVDNPQQYFPRLDALDDWPGVVLEQTLQQRAQTNSQLYVRPAQQVSGSVFVSDPPFDSYHLGDDVALHFDDAFTHDDPEELGIGRLTAMDVNPREGSVIWTIQKTQSPPARGRPSTNERLGAIEVDAATSFRRGNRTRITAQTLESRIAALENQVFGR